MVFASDTLRNETGFAPLGAISITDSIINYGKLFLNTPYRYGSAGTASFDCSGFTSHVYKNFGYLLERSSADQAKQFPTVDKNHLKPGDLVFFNGRRRNGRVGHVGIVVAAKEDGEFDFIHASVNEGVTISNSKADYYLKRFVKAGRVINADSFFLANAVSGSNFYPQLNTSPYTQTAAPAVQVNNVRKVIPAKYHTVRSGETLSHIAEKYNISVAQLKRKNKLKNENLQIKQRIKIKDEEVLMVAEPVKQELANVKPIKGKDPLVQQDMLTDNAKNTSTYEHKVMRGESLYTIAKKYDIPVKTLVEINNINNGKIIPGQILRLASSYAYGSQIADDAQPAANDTKSIDDNKSQVLSHRVASGETLSSISRLYGIPSDDLMKINKLKNSRISEGQVLQLRPNEPVLLAQEQSAKQQTAAQVKPKETAPAPKPQVVKQTQQTPAAETVKPLYNPDEITNHSISSGETLASISAKYGMTIEELQALNEMKGKTIYSGQTLKVKKLPKALAATENRFYEHKPTSSIKKTHYKVQPGESLFIISQRYNISIPELKMLNNMESDNIQAGQTIYVPDRDIAVVETHVRETPENSRPAATTINDDPASLKYHKVGNGETLTSIAVKYGCTIKQIKNWNNIQSDRLNVGETLKIHAR
ncbi:MAG: hypothetical protein H6Q20_180 [Bacteroidetes bacterium]|nr:hypothetical protein [Bacteroidota bacterium]